MAFEHLEIPKMQCRLSAQKRGTNDVIKSYRLFDQISQDMVFVWNIILYKYNNTSIVYITFSSVWPFHCVPALFERYSTHQPICYTNTTISADESCLDLWRTPSSIATTMMRPCCKSRVWHVVHLLLSLWHPYP